MTPEIPDTSLGGGRVKSWVQKLVNQFNFDDENQPADETPQVALSEDRATLLYLLDVYNKHLLEIENHPVRKVREILDETAKELINPERDAEKALFRLRQFLGSYRIAEYSYLQKTFDDFRGIIWDFVDQLAEEIDQEQTADREMHHSLKQLREAVEANSIDTLKTHSRRFIDHYVEHQTRKDKRRADRIVAIKKNLDSVRNQLFEANSSMRLDHLTQAFNRKSFDEQMAQHVRMQSVSQQPVTLLALDIDYFKRVNDTFGHAIGDFVLKECVKTLQDVFKRPGDFVARIGGEEFAILLPNTSTEDAEVMVNDLLNRVRKDVFVHEGHKLNFTLSVGIAALDRGETPDSWLKRADEALYRSKQTGRDRFTLAAPHSETKKAA